MLLFSTNVLVKAQKFIPKLRASLSTITFSENRTDVSGDNIRSKFGFVVGAAFELPTRGKFSLQPELLFYQKGYKETANMNEVIFGVLSFKTFVTLNYVELPVLVKASVGSFYVCAGPSVALGLAGRYRMIATGTPSFSHSGKIKFGTREDGDRVDTSYIDNNVDLGIQLGGGYRLADLLVIDLRYGFGLINIFDKSTRNRAGSSGSKLRSFQIAVGFPIRLLKK